MAGALDLLEVHDRARVVGVERIRRQARAQVARGQHRKHGQQVGGDLLVVLAVVAEGAHLCVEHLVALRLRDVVLVVGNEGQQVGTGRFGRALEVAAMGVVQQLLHLRQLAPVGAQGALIVAAQRAFENRLDTAFDVLRQLHEVRPLLEFDQPLHDDVDRVPAEGREGARRVGRHDRLDARGDLGWLLPVEGEVQPHAGFGEGGVELQEGVGRAPVFAGALRHAL
mmetsp:Transcript_38697/g.90508  ORF Transcript_38697/g.90508 Transcript_38697/m.90508 type:complete len:225 (+) Transcript_38697:803-1477(+)